MPSSVMRTLFALKCSFDPAAGSSTSNNGGLLLESFAMRRDRRLGLWVENCLQILEGHVVVAVERQVVPAQLPDPVEAHQQVGFLDRKT